MSERVAETRARYRHFVPVGTRWNDNDLYGHVNNAVYYEFFDTAVNVFLVREGRLDIHGGTVVGIVAESFCRYRKPIAYPEAIEVGLRVGRLGTSSVRYELAVFREGDDEAAADGHFVHVFVDRASMRPTPIPAGIRTAFERILAP
jgi:acyl-CoA thioester hydrolase